MEDNDLCKLFENMDLGVVFLDSEGIITRINPAACQMLGMNPGQVIGSPITDPLWQSVHEDGSDVVPDQHPAILSLKSGEAVLNNFIGVYNRIRENYSWLLVNAFPLNNDGESNPSRIFCTFEDITKLKHAFDSLAQSEERFQRIFNEGPLGMAVIGSDFRFLSANSAFCSMIGYTEKELESMTFKDITHPDHLAQDFEAVKKVLYGVIPNYKTEKRYVRKNKQVLWASLTLLAIHDQTGHLLHFLAMVEPRHKSLKLKL
ncbi:MAG: PAS domain S-box protein [Bacteroidales bacterium]|jgi:PAS domain S-box-containing protein|nr:PAS domain S-box protein [Bacteroidales bacterium]